MNGINMLSDAEIVAKISARLKELRLKQNITRQELSAESGVSVASIARIEGGEIKSFDSFMRILRTLGRIGIFLPLVEEEPISPNEYLKMVQTAGKHQRKRASKSIEIKKREDTEW